MPPLTDEHTRGNVIRQWILGFPRDTIAEHIGIGAGTVSNIVANYKAGLEELDFDSIRQLAVEARQHGWNFANLASHARLYNYFIKSGTAEDKIESFITKASSNDIPPERVIELVYQLHEISKQESIPLDQIPDYIKQKFEQKQKIDEDIQEAETILQSKNVSIEAINEHIQLNQKLNEYGLSMHNIDELLNLVLNAKEYGFEPKKIVGKLRSIKRLEKKEKGLKNNCTIFSNLLDRHKETVPLAKLIEAMHIGKNELISFKVAVNEAAELYGFPRSTAAVYVLNYLRDYNKKGQLKKELSSLYLQKYAVEEFCSRHGQVIMALMNLQSNGMTEEQIISLNNSLESNGYKTSSYTSTK
jgi:hypothetical protein